MKNLRRENQEMKVKGHWEEVHNRNVHSLHGRHMLPHERKNMFRVEFDEIDYEVFKDVYGDEDTVITEMRKIYDAPPEVQGLVYQILSLIKEVE